MYTYCTTEALYIECQYCEDVWYFPLYDNNGNVTDYVSETGEVVASYAYDAFGRTLSATGSMADTFPFRFSTKYYDAESGLYYYGYRYYSPELGRWLTRDPIEEDGGDNLYAFCGNNPISLVDYDGLWALTLISDETPDDDAKLWRKYDKESIIISNVSSRDEMFRIMNMLVRLHGGQKITRLNLSGHGLIDGAGIQFSTPPHFDLINLPFARQQQLRNLLAINASIYLWSCKSAQTKLQCSKLRSMARNLDAVIIAKNANVGSGPDIGTGWADFFSKVRAYFIRSAEPNEWRVFRPLPSLFDGATKDGPEARILMERRIK